MLALTVSLCLLLERTQLYATSLLGLLLVGVLGVEIMRRVTPGIPTAPRAPSVGGAVNNLQALLDVVPAALIVVREGGRAELANRAARRLTGANVTRLADVDLLGTASAARILSMQTGQPELLRLADGRHVLVSIGEFQRGEERERLVALQFVTGDLDVVELKAWRDMLRVLRHEIMNSLTPIASLSESLAAAPPTEETQTSIEAIRRRSRALMEFVDRYREVLEPVVAHVHGVHAGELLQSIERLMASDCARARVRPIFAVEPPDLAFRADSALLEQAVINLLRNAVDAVHDVPTPHIQVKFELQGDEVCLRVTDNGCGISPERREQVFLPFFTTKRAGSGIGLSVSRNIALAHAGRIEYQPAVTGGSEFRIFLGTAAYPVCGAGGRASGPPESPKTSANR